MGTMHSEERIGEAWRKHRANDHESAIQIFEDILSRTPDNLDAHYGLGLALRSVGKKEDAVDAFQKALQLAKDALKAIETTSSVDGHRGSNDLDTYEDDRFLMLNRMLRQRLNELGVDA